MKDVVRVIAALKSAKLEFGAVGYYYSRDPGERDSAEELVSSYVDRLNCWARSAANKEGFDVNSKQNVYNVDKSVWVAGCIIIK